MKIVFQSIGILLILAANIFLAEASAQSAAREDEIEEMLNQAQKLRYEGKYDDGLDLAEMARTLSAGLQNPEIELEAIYQLALLYYHKQEYSRARAELEVGLARARAHELKHLEADFLAAEGVLEWKQGNLHLALPKLQAAMAIGERNEDHVSLASISNNIGIIYYTLKNYEDAEFYYRKGLELLEKSDNERLRGSLYSNLAEILIPMDRLKEAEGYLFAALEIDQKSQEPQQLAYTYFTLGELFSRKGESTTAIDYYHKALALQKQIADKWAMALTHLKISQEYLITSTLDRSLKEAELGYDMAVSLNAISLLRDYSEHFVKIYQGTGDQGRSRFYMDQYEWLKDRIKLEETGMDVDEPPLQPIVQTRDDAISPMQTVIIIILAALIIVLILENARLRNKIARL